MSISASQSRAIEITERVSSILSLLGAGVIIATFLSDRSFRKPINRLVFYAAWGNVVTNIATLIGVSAVHLGAAAPLCQFQGFIIQMFMPADAFWTFAMACNVYLTFFHQYDAAKLRTLELRYLLACYGLPFVPAIVYCFLQDADRGKVYGPAVLWCWVSLEWDALRIATFYGPVWVAIIATFAIYVCAGSVVFKWRDQLVQVARSNSVAYQANEDADNDADSRELEPVASPTTTKMKVSRDASGVWVTSPEEEEGEGPVQEKNGPLNSPNALDVPLHAVRSASNASARSTPAPMPTTAQANRAAVNYCKCAMLFFVALLVTWVPSTVNRVYTLVHPHHAVVFGLNYSSGLVLPLQGFWNAVVYIVTSFEAFKALYSRLRTRTRIATTRPTTMPLPRRRTQDGSAGKLHPRSSCLSLRTESTENLTDM